MNIERFVFLFLFDLMVSKTLHKCNRGTGASLVIFHHVISVMLWWNFMIGILGPKAHAVAMLSVVGLWFVTGGRCFLTKIHNNMCGINTNQPFSNAQGYILGKKMSTHLTLTAILLVIDFYLNRSGRKVLF